MYDLDKEQITYTVHEPRFAHFLAALFFLLPILFMIGTVLTWHEGIATRIIMVFFCCCFLIPALMMALSVKLRGLFVLRGGQDFIYRNMFGKETRFSVHDISHVVLGSNGVRGAFLRIMHKDERILCTLEMNMVPVDRLLSDLGSKNIPVREEVPNDRLITGGAAARRRAEKELALEAMTEAEYEEYARGTKRLHTASIIMQVVSVMLAAFMIWSGAFTFGQMSLFFACWPIVFLIFGLMGHRHYSLYDASYLRKHGATERYIETVVPFPFFGMLGYAALSMMPGVLINDANEWATICFGLLEMAIVLLIVFLVIRGRISVLATVLFVPLVFFITFSHAIHLNWTLGTKHTETAWVERTEIVKGSRSTDYYIYVDDGNGQPVRYTTTRSIVTNKQTGDTVTLLINDSVFGIRQIFVRK